jgi:hypothetical protein
VGELSLTRAGRGVRISTLDFWGRREETHVPRTDVVPPLRDVTRAQLAQAVAAPVLPLDGAPRPGCLRVGFVCVGGARARGSAALTCHTCALIMLPNRRRRDAVLGERQFLLSLRFGTALDRGALLALLTGADRAWEVVAGAAGASGAAPSEAAAAAPAAPPGGAASAAAASAGARDARPAAAPRGGAAVGDA